MTDKTKSRLQAIPLLVCSLCCVALAIPTAVSAVKADTTSPITSDIDYSTPISFSQLGTWEIGMWYNNRAGSATQDSARNIQLAIPLFKDTETFTGSGGMSNTDTGGYVNLKQTWEYSATGYEYYIGTLTEYTPGQKNYLPTATFYTGSFVLPFTDFKTLCHNTTISLPVGVQYNYSAYAHVLDSAGNFQFVTYKSESAFANIGDWNDATPTRTIANILGDHEHDSSMFTNFFEALPTIENNIVVADLRLEIVADDILTSEAYPNIARSRNAFALECTFDTNVTYDAFSLSFETFAEYLRGQFNPVAPTDVLFSPLTAFFETELFDGFTMGTLLIIALGCLLFGLFLKIFVGG